MSDPAFEHLRSERLRLDRPAEADLVSRGPGAGNPDAVRLVFADQALGPEVIVRVLA
ncbi:hypothetical protein [Agromyces intestinalis]|uniref:hypothetical protein n=1 Tax=Agromyces intestinalis TaxID=2592652 RepID=UPI00143DA4BB|nr:hypothetical protein [Agromyces intestinalis]